MPVNVKQFIFAGKALFTIKNETTGNHMTFKVVQAHDRSTNAPKEMWFASVLVGPDNNTMYRYMGAIVLDAHPTIAGMAGEKVPVLRTTPKSRVTPEAQSWKVLAWLLKHMDNLPANVKFYHEGRCGRCGRRLTVPESIENGFGPECVQLIMGRAA